MIAGVTFNIYQQITMNADETARTTPSSYHLPPTNADKLMTVPQTLLLLCRGAINSDSYCILLYLLRRPKRIVVGSMTVSIQHVFDVTTFVRYSEEQTVSRTPHAKRESSGKLV